MVASASRGSDTFIRLVDYQRALGWMLEAELAMNEIFKALGARGDGQVIEEAYHYLYKIFMATNEPVAENRLIGFVSEKVPAYNVLRIIDVMEKSGRIEKGINSKTGILGWKPKPRVV